MQKFHDFYFGLGQNERIEYVSRAGVTTNYAEQVAGGFKLPSLRTAVKLSRESDGRVAIEDIVHTYEYRHGEIA